MPGNTSGNKGNSPSGWYSLGLNHVWLLLRANEDGDPAVGGHWHGRLSHQACRWPRELIDGIASWWTACHGYNQLHIRAAVEDQLGRMPHVMFGGMVHEPALTLASVAPGRPDGVPADLDRVFFSDSVCSGWSKSL